MRGFIMETIITKRENGVMLITLNRPHFKNAINCKMIDELEAVINEAKKEKEVKVVVITGSAQSFSSGGDLSEFHGMKTQNQVEPMLNKMGSLLQQIENLGKPTIAHIDGYALGGGAELALACDLCYVTEKAKLGFIQITLGLTTGWGGGVRLIQKLGRSKALSLLLTGEIISATKIIEYGISDKMVDSLAETVTSATKIAEYSLEAIQSYIQSANNVSSLQEMKLLQKEEINRCSYLWESPEHELAVERFLSSKK